VKPLRIEELLDSVFAEMTKEKDVEKRLALRLTLVLHSGKEMTGVPISFSGTTGKEKNQLVLWREGTQSDMLFIDVASISAVVVHNVAAHAHWLVPDWAAPPVQAELPGRFQVNKKTQDLSASLSNGLAAKIDFKINWQEVTGSTDDKGNNANPEAMFWLVEAMIKAEGALSELKKEADFNKECLPLIKEVSFGGGAKGVAKTAQGLHFKVDFKAAKNGFFASPKATQAAILEVF